jgi:hypothetical protein
MAIDPKKNLDDIGFLIYELKDIYTLTDDPDIDNTVPNPLDSLKELEPEVVVLPITPEYKRLQDYDGNIKIWLDKIIDLTQAGNGSNNFNYNEIDDVNTDFFENASQSEKDELDIIFSGNLDFSNPTNEELQSVAFRVYEAYQLLKQLY